MYCACRVLSSALKFSLALCCGVFYGMITMRLGHATRTVSSQYLPLYPFDYPLTEAYLMKPKKLVCGVGFNDADYAVQKFETIGYVAGKIKQKKVWVCPYYRAWASMLERCYSAKYQERYLTYKGCSVSEEWLKFSNFKSWMEKQDWEGKHLDKDLLFEGNKVYSAETCVFVTQAVNKFANDNGAARGEWLIGVDWHKKEEKFRALCSNPLTRKREHLGYFDCEQQAHKAWTKRKLELAHELAAEQTDPRVAKALIDRYSKPYTDKALK